ncbi:MAG: dTMP kinase [Gemmatimonadota bacterium]
MSGRADGREGLFIVFEGVEGAGKSTQLIAVADRLRRAGVDHLVVREPGGTPVGEQARALVLSPDLEMCAESELFLYLTSRAEFVRRLVIPALDAGRLVLADRYELSTLAYQGAARGLDLDRVRDANRLATGGLVPDLTVLLRIAPERGRGRQSGQADRLESERAEFHESVAAAYDRMAASDPAIVTVAADGEPAGVHDQIWRELSRRWPDRFPPARAETGNIWSANEFQEKSSSASGETTEATGQEVE